jgi:hypothetical protein
MELLNLNKIYDPIRNEWVKRTSEETIRQRLLQKMIGELGFPRSLIAVEKELQRLPHVSLSLHSKIPKRRADIIVFFKDLALKDSLVPLLLIECKAAALTPQFAQQVISYNYFVNAPFISLVNEKHTLMGKYEASSAIFSFTPGLPSYSALLTLLQKTP